jgi:hypothetical protein
MKYFAILTVSLMILVSLVACSGEGGDDNNSVATSTQTGNNSVEVNTQTGDKLPVPSQRGCLRGNCVNGEGEIFYSPGITYSGQFVNGIREGRGTQIHFDGSKYIGKFKNDTFEGNGVLYSKSGQIISKGQFKNGKFIESSSLKLGISTDFQEGDTVKFSVTELGGCADYDWAGRGCYQIDEVKTEVWFFGTITNTTNKKYKLEQTDFLIIRKDKNQRLIGSIDPIPPNYENLMSYRVEKSSAKEPYYVEKSRVTEYVHSRDGKNAIGGRRFNVAYK